MYGEGSAWQRKFCLIADYQRSNFRQARGKEEQEGRKIGRPIFLI